MALLASNKLSTSIAIKASLLLYDLTLKFSLKKPWKFLNFY